MTELQAWPCQSACAWAATPRRHGGLPVFECAGCGSEWVRSLGWTPVDRDGTVPAAVVAEKSRR